MRRLVAGILVTAQAIAAGCASSGQKPTAPSPPSDSMERVVSLPAEARPYGPIKALFVHGPESSGRNDVVVWREVLAPYGIEVFGRIKDELEPTDFSEVDLVLAGTGTSDGSQRSGFSPMEGLKATHRPWEGPRIVKMLSESGLPIIEVGADKYRLFYELGSPDRSGLKRYESDDRLVIRVPADSQEYLREPFPIDDGPITLTSAAGVFSYYCPPPSMGGIVAEVDKPGLYPVVRYRQYVSWRLGRDARRLPEEGRRLFANIAYALVRDDRERTDAERLADPRQRNYDNALEYYRLFGDKPFNPRELEAKVLDDSVSAQERRRYLRARRLCEFRLDWHVEPPDTVVSEADRDAVSLIIDERFPDEAARRKWEKVTLRFYGGRRCHVAILEHWDDQSFSGWGNDLYLIKHEGEWKVIYEYAWI